MNYEKLLRRAWLAYRHDWAAVRGYDFRAVSRAFYQDREYNGEMWAYLAEFEDCEFQEPEIMEALLSPADFKEWQKFIPEDEAQPTPPTIPGVCCPRCRGPLYASDLPQYKYQCFECDEDFYSFEAVQEV